MTMEFWNVMLTKIGEAEKDVYIIFWCVGHIKSELMHPDSKIIIKTPGLIKRLG